MKRLARIRPTPAFALTFALLVVGLVPLPKGSTMRWVRQNARSQELNRADRKATEAGYYEGLLNVGNDAGSTPGGLAASLIGQSSDSISFHDIGVTRYMYGDVLQFELKEGLRRVAFGRPFTTNALGLRDHEYPRTKPPGTLRIAVLGSSIDMGWGVADDETYENRFEDWLNTHAEKVGSDQRFEVLNFAMAAYSPVHRRESFRRKASLLDVDLVLFSATLLDPRLTQIHLVNLLQDRATLPPEYLYLRSAAMRAGVVPDDLHLAADGSLSDKSTIKEKIDTQLWPVIDVTLGGLADDCRAAGTPLVVAFIPRAGEADTPVERREDVGRYMAIVAGHGIKSIDLTSAFDDEDPAAVSLAVGDDHPNARGHSLLFRALARAVVEDDSLYTSLFGPDAASRRSSLGVVEEVE